MTHKLLNKLFSAETEDIKLAVEKLYMEQDRHASDPTFEETDPEKILWNIEDLPILEHVGELIHCQTGFIISYLCAGPNPQNNWNISATSYHVGKTLQGNDFSMVYPAIDEDVLAAFIDFAELVYSPDQRKSSVDNSVGSTSSTSPCNHDYLKTDTGELSKRETDIEGGEHQMCNVIRGLGDVGSLYNFDAVSDASPAANGHDMLCKPAQAMTTWQVVGLMSGLTHASMVNNEHCTRSAEHVLLQQSSHCPPMVTSTADNWENDNMLSLDWSSSGYVTPCSSITNFSLDDILTEGFNAFRFDAGLSSTPSGTLPVGAMLNLDMHNDLFSIPSTLFLPDLPLVNTATETAWIFEEPPPQLNLIPGSFSAAMENAIPALPHNCMSPVLYVSSANKDMQGDQPECTNLRGKQSISEQGILNHSGDTNTQTAEPTIVDMWHSTCIPKKSTQEQLMNAIGSNPPHKKCSPSSVNAKHLKSKYICGIFTAPFADTEQESFTTQD
ncbi:hypothetical protein EDC04DRAFT_2902827 [Pisolithus marmoratus]|nr:hypothetical protein EDC04DRAFT_2902827 [Pisolithus marmoratus]